MYRRRVLSKALKYLQIICFEAMVRSAYRSSKGSQQVKCFATVEMQRKLIY